MRNPIHILEMEGSYYVCRRCGIQWYAPHGSGYREPRFAYKKCHATDRLKKGTVIRVGYQGEIVRMEIERIEEVGIWARALDGKPECRRVQVKDIVDGPMV